MSMYLLVRFARRGAIDWWVTDGVLEQNYQKEQRYCQSHRLEPAPGSKPYKSMSSWRMVTWRHTSKRCALFAWSSYTLVDVYVSTGCRYIERSGSRRKPDVNLASRTDKLNLPPLTEVCRALLEIVVVRWCEVLLNPRRHCTLSLPTMFQSH